MKANLKKERTEPKEQFSLRERPYIKKQLIKRYGSMQKAWNHFIVRLFSNENTAEEER